MVSPVVIKDIFWEYYLCSCDVYYGKYLVELIDNSYLQYDGRYRTTATKSHDVSSQYATTFTNIPVKTLSLNKERPHYITIIYSKSTPF